MIKTTMWQFYRSRHFIGLDQLTADTMRDGFAVCRDYFHRAAELNLGYKYCSINWNYMPPAGGGADSSAFADNCRT